MKRVALLLALVVALLGASVVWGNTANAGHIKRAIPSHKVRLRPNMCIGSPTSGFLSVHIRPMCGGSANPPYCGFSNQGQRWYGTWHPWNSNIYYTRWWTCGTVVIIGGNTFAAWLFG